MRKILFVLYVLLTLLLLAGRDHYLLGSLLIAGRWLWLAAGLLFFVNLRKTSWTQRHLAVGLLLLALSGEYLYGVYHRAGLSCKRCHTEVSLLTYNVFFRNRLPQRSLDVITQSQAELITLQEVTPEWQTLLGQRLKHSHPFSRSLARNGTHGMAVFSSLRIVSDTFLNDDSGRPVAQFVELEKQGKKLLLINTHLASPAAAVEHPEAFLQHFSSSYALRRQQFSEIGRLIAACYSHVGSLILAGDLNTLWAEPLYRDLQYNWVDLFREKGKGSARNFPNSSRSAPLVTLDYIMLRGAIGPVRARVQEGGSSDHLGVYGIVKF